MSGNTVTLSIEEYKDLILKTVVTQHEKLFYDKFKELILDNIRYDSSDYSSISHVDAISDDKFVREVLTFIKVLDKPLFVQMIEKVYALKKAADEEEEALKKAKAKEKAEKERLSAIASVSGEDK